MSLVDKATQFIALKHDGQSRRGLDIPYSTHVFGVARILKNAKYPEEIVVAGMLHDILEDSDATEQEIESIFGINILQLVKAVSSIDKSIPWRERKQLAIDSVKQLTEEEAAVAIAEKIQNLNAMAYVIQNNGEDAWFGNGANKSDQLWFYEKYFWEIKQYHPNSKLFKEFEQCVERLYSLI